MCCSRYPVQRVLGHGVEWLRRGALRRPRHCVRGRQNCSCTAYASTKISGAPFPNFGQDLYVRLAIADLGRTCMPEHRGVVLRKTTTFIDSLRHQLLLLYHPGTTRHLFLSCGSNRWPSHLCERTKTRVFLSSITWRYLASYLE